MGVVKSRGTSKIGGRAHQGAKLKALGAASRKPAGLAKRTIASPSMAEARLREAARQSAVDLGDDVTDASTEDFIARLCR